MPLGEREVHRYYQPWLAAHGSSLNVADNVESIAEHDLKGKGYQARASRDTALTAFAQLITLRLNVKRCMVSLIDSTNQYILAEATRHNNLSGVHSEVDSGDDLWLGTTILKRTDAVCEHCYYNTCVGLESNGKLYAAKGLIVNDCRLDDRFKDRPYVQEEPGVRFYAGVPLTSRHGYMIGALAISDGRPRDGLRASEVRLLQETAQSVMEHLEWARDRVDRFKGERIVRGSKFYPMQTRQLYTDIRKWHLLSRTAHPCGMVTWQKSLIQNLLRLLRMQRAISLGNLQQDRDWLPENLPVVYRSRLRQEK